MATRGQPSEHRKGGHKCISEPCSRTSKTVSTTRRDYSHASLRAQPRLQRSLRPAFAHTTWATHFAWLGVPSVGNAPARLRCQLMMSTNAGEAKDGPPSEASCSILASWIQHACGQETAAGWVGFKSPIDLMETLRNERPRERS